MRRIAFIIPGYNCSEKKKEYQVIAGFFKKQGIEPILVKMDWKRKTFENYIQQFMDCYKSNFNKNYEVYVLGFSFGAMTALLTASEIKPKALFLCSLSPFFKEDLPTIKQWWIHYWGKRRQQEFKQMSFVEIAKKINCKTYIIAGTKEGREVAKRAKDAKKKIKNSELIFLEGVKHDISDIRYLKKIKEIVNVI